MKQKEGVCERVWHIVGAQPALASSAAYVFCLQEKGGTGGSLHTVQSSGSAGRPRLPSGGQIVGVRQSQDGSSSGQEPGVAGMETEAAGMGRRLENAYGDPKAKIGSP